MWISLSTVRALCFIVVPLFGAAVVGWHPDPEEVNSMMYEEFGDVDYMNRNHIGLTHGTVTPRLTTSTVISHATAISSSNNPAITDATTTLDSSESTTSIVVAPSSYSKPTQSASLLAENSDFYQIHIEDNQYQEATDFLPTSLPTTNTMSNLTYSSGFQALTSAPLPSLTSVSFVSTTFTPSTAIDPTDTGVVLDSTTSEAKSTSTPVNDDEEQNNDDEQQNDGEEQNSSTAEENPQQGGGRNTVTSFQFVTNTPTDAAGAQQTGGSEVTPVVQSGENAAPKLSAGAWICVMLGLGSVVAGML